MGRLRGFGLVPNTLLAGLNPVLATEFIDAAGGVDDFLLAGIERMAGRTDIDADRVRFQGRTGLKRITAAARYGEVLVSWMDIGFHWRA